MQRESIFCGCRECYEFRQSLRTTYEAVAYIFVLAFAVWLVRSEHSSSYLAGLRDYDATDSSQEC